MINDALLLESLHDFFDKPYNRDKLLSVLSDDKCISLRSIDWFITNYSKKNNTYYLIYNDNNGNPSFDDENNGLHDFSRSNRNKPACRVMIDGWPSSVTERSILLSSRTWKNMI